MKPHRSIDEAFRFDLAEARRTVEIGIRNGWIRLPSGEAFNRAVKAGLSLERKQRPRK